MIPFNRPLFTGRERAYVDEALASRKLAGAGAFSERCNAWLSAHFGGASCLVTASASHALEMAALLCDLEPGDEVILPSYAFPTTASAFARCGASLVFVDVVPATMNIDPAAVAAAITSRTRVIVALHYGGVACDMDALCSLARTHDLIVVEDAAQALGSRYADRPCGTIGAFGCISFHESKNLHCGEGGAFVCNDPRYWQRAQVVLEKGTNRTQYFRGEVDKYTWQEIGSSYVMSELTAAFLLPQLHALEEVTSDRRRSWDAYAANLEQASVSRYLEMAVPPAMCFHNGHMFWIKLRDAQERDALMAFLIQRGIHSVFHYQPLHSAPAGLRYGRFQGADVYTTRDAERLLRLPMYFGLTEVDEVVAAIAEFFRQSR